MRYARSPSRQEVAGSFRLLASLLASDSRHTVLELGLEQHVRVAEHAFLERHDDELRIKKAENN
jgi:hypothetical protein